MISAYMRDRRMNLGCSAESYGVFEAPGCKESIDLGSGSSDPSPPGAHKRFLQTISGISCSYVFKKCLPFPSRVFTPVTTPTSDCRIAIGIVPPVDRGLHVMYDIKSHDMKLRMSHGVGILSDRVMEYWGYLRRAGQMGAERYLYIMACSPCVQNTLATTTGHMWEM
jgi:hypothetical protein